MACKLFLGIVVLYFMSGIQSLAQKVSVTADTARIADSVRMRLPALAQYQQKAAHLRKEKIADSLTSLPDNFPVQKVYSEKYLKKIEDSLRSIGAYKLPLDPRQEITEEDLVEAINQKYPHAQGLSAPPGAEGAPDLSDSLNRLPSLPADFQDLSSYKLPGNSLEELSPLPGKIMKSKYVDKIDSLRQIKLKEARLKLSEYKISDHGKVTQLKEKPDFLKRSYFEGVIGIMGKDLIVYQVSPAFGYHLTDYISLGVGPSLQLRKDDGEIQSAIGLRTFAKAEFFKRQVYAQVEDAMHSNRSSIEEMQLNVHNVLVGGGVLLSLRTALTLNFSLMYNVNQGNVEQSDVSPMIFRLGISSVKLEK